MHVAAAVVATATRFVFTETYGKTIAEHLTTWAEALTKIRIRHCPRKQYDGLRFKNVKQHKWPPRFLARIKDPDNHLEDRYHPNPRLYDSLNKQFPQGFRGYSTREPIKIFKR